MVKMGEKSQMEVSVSKEREPASGVPEGARRATGGAPEERRDGRGRWSAKRKTAAVLRLLRGEDIESLSCELGVDPARKPRESARLRV